MNERITTAGVAFIDGKVLIAQRKEGGPLSMKWEFPGGKNRYTESVEDTLKREWMEELGVDIDVFEELTTVEFTNGGVRYHLKARRVEPKSTDFRLNEHLDLKLVPPSELLSFSYGDSDRQIASYLSSSFS